MRTSWWRSPFILMVIFLITLGLIASACARFQSQAAQEATVVAMVDARLTAVAAEAGVIDAQATSDVSNAVTSTVPDDPRPEGPLLITPTPDRSGEIMAMILENTRHFIGDSAAPVSIVEFSDFQ